MNDAALKALIDSDPANAGKTHEQVRDWCNEKTEKAPVLAIDIKRYLMIIDKLVDIKLESEIAVVTPKTRAAKAFFIAIDTFPEFDLTNPTYLNAVTARLDALITHGLIDATDKATLLALGNNKRSRADAAGLGEIWGADVKRVRGG